MIARRLHITAYSVEKSLIIEEALRVGFDLAGITSAEPVDEAMHLRESIDAGRNATLAWLARNPEARCDPKSLLRGARSVICCALAYGEGGMRSSKTGDTEQTGQSSQQSGKIHVARFARGEDYHVVVREKLEQLWETIKKDTLHARAKLCVDTSPILEKALAARAGLGWIGKHTILLNREIGSWFMLGEIITDLELPYDRPTKNLCGDCSACMDACPTRALKAPCVLDARLCISYLSIENGGAIPQDLARFIPDGTHGCDLCQEACPYNEKRNLP
jgi:epoxyqueuosine reductase